MHGTPASTALRHYVYVSASRLLLVPATLASTVLVARLLGVERYGSLMLFVALVQGSTFCISEWTALGFVRFGREEFHMAGRIAQVLWQRLLLLLGLLLLAAALTFGLSSPIHRFVGMELSWWWLPLLLVGAVSSSVSLGMLQIYERMTAFAVLSVADRLLYFAALAALAALRVPELTWVLAVLTASKWVIAPAALSRLPIQAWWPPRFRGASLRKLAAYSWPMLAAAPFLFDSVQLWIIRVWLPIASVSVYGIAYQFLVLATALSTAVNAVLFPRLVSWRLDGRTGALKQFTERTLTQVGFGGSLAVIVIAWLSGRLVPLAFGPGYAAAIPLLWLVGPAAAFQLGAGFLGSVLAAFDHTRSMMLVTTSYIVSTLGSTALLTPWIGANGAALGLSIGGFVAAAVGAWSIHQRVGVSCWTLVLCPLPAVAAALLWFGLRTLRAPADLVLILPAVALLVSRSLGLFSARDLLALDVFHLPAPLRAPIAWFLRMENVS